MLDYTDPSISSRRHCRQCFWIVPPLSFKERRITVWFGCQGISQESTVNQQTGQSTSILADQIVLAFQGTQKTGGRWHCHNKKATCSVTQLNACVTHLFFCELPRLYASQHQLVFVLSTCFASKPDNRMGASLWKIEIQTCQTRLRREVTEESSLETQKSHIEVIATVFSKYRISFQISTHLLNAWHCDLD